MTNPTPVASTDNPTPRRGALPPHLLPFADDLGFIRELVTIFRSDSGPLLAEIRDGLRRGDAVRLRVAAHTLAGAVGYFSTGPAHRAALRLETMARAGTLDGAAAVREELEVEIAHLYPLLAELAGE